MSQEPPRQSQIDNPKSKMEEPWTVKRLRDWTTQFLSKKGIEKPDVEAQILLAHALGWKRLDLFTIPNLTRRDSELIQSQQLKGC